MFKLIKELMNYAGKHKILTYIAMIFSGIFAILALIPFVYIWLIIKEALEVMPNFENATNIVHNGWMAVTFALTSMLIYFVGLLFSHKSAFRVAANMKLKCMKHILKMPIGKVNDIGSGKLRKIVIESSNSTETFLAHQLPDISGAIVTPIVMIIILFVFDWRLGLVSLVPTILGFIAMSKMMGKAMADDMKKYQDSMEDMNNEAVEYVRGMPIVKTFGQTVHTFKRFKKSIDNYEQFCISYTKKARKTMLQFQVFINSVFAFLIAVTFIVSANGNITQEFILNLLFYIIYTPIISTTKARVMYISEHAMTITDSLNRINEILDIEPLSEVTKGEKIKDNSIKLEDVTFSYDKNDKNVLDKINLNIEPNSLVALVGPSGGGKSTIASLITRFYDADSGAVKIGGSDVKNIRKEELSNLVSFVFQDSKLLKASILENVKMALSAELGTAVFVISSQLLLKFGIATVALVGATLLVNGEISIMTFFMYLLVVSRIYDPMSSTLVSLASINAQKLSIERMNEFNNYEIQKGDNRINLNTYDIELKNVGFSYNDKETVLKDVSFIAKQGEVTAIVGSSGSGKTTISKLCARFWDTNKGIITFWGKDISKVDPEVLLENYSIVFQDVTLFNNTIMENIRIGRKGASDEEVLKAAKQANCDEFVKKLPDGYNTLIGENGSRLSGGERQRISIARAILKNAPVILLDEATASLDAENETQI